MPSELPQERGLTSASQTAMLVAGYRARMTAAGSTLCQDPWAAALAGDQGIALTQRMDAASPNMELWLGTRITWLDNAVRRLAGHFPQAVVLGAGFDTRAERLGLDLTWFEVDHPHTLAERKRRLAALSDYPSDVAIPVACDFESQDPFAELMAAGFRRDVPALIIWEGVSYYLTADAVRATLAGVVANTHPSTTILFDAVRTKMATGRVQHQADRDVLEVLDQVGEPFRWGVDDPVAYLYELGFRHVHVTTFDEACLNLTGTYDRDHRFGMQWLLEASVTGPVDAMGSR